MTDLGFGVIVVPILMLVAGLLMSRLRLASEHERFAVFNFGKFEEFRGPGLLFKFTSKQQQPWIRLRAGDRGRLLQLTVGLFDGTHIPVEVEGVHELGAFVRIVRFNRTVAWVRQDADQTRAVVCEKCGHENIVR